jgi:hypothetical protein
MYVICSAYKECPRTNDECDWKTTQDCRCRDLSEQRIPLSFHCTIIENDVRLDDWEILKDE